MAIFISDDFATTPTSGTVNKVNHAWMDNVFGVANYTPRLVNGRRALVFPASFGCFQVNMPAKTTLRIRMVAQYSGTQTNHGIFMGVFDNAATPNLLGDVQIRNVAGKPVHNRWNFVSASPVQNWAADTPWRFELYWEVGVQTILYIWTDPNSTGSPDYTMTKTATTGVPDRLRFGNANSSTGLEILISDFAMSDGELIGPPPISVWENTAEGGADGTTVTAANSGVGSDMPFVGPTLGSGTIKFSNVEKQRGSLSYQFNKSGTNAQYLSWDPPNGSFGFAFRGYFRWIALPSGGTSLVAFRSLTGGTARCGIAVTNEGSIYITDQSEASIWSSPVGVLNTTDWFRIECLGVIGGPTGGAMSLRVYKGDSMTTEVSVDLTGKNFQSTAVGWIRMGYASAGTTAASPMYMDDIAYHANSAVLIGPSGVAPPSGPVIRGIISGGVLVPATLRGLIQGGVIVPATTRGFSPL